MEGGEALSTDKQNESTPSYTYWVRQTTQDAAPLPLPKKLTSEDLNNQANNPQTHLGSAWNRVSPAYPLSFSYYFSYIEREKEKFDPVCFLYIFGRKIT